MDYHNISSHTMLGSRIFLAACLLMLHLGAWAQSTFLRSYNQTPTGARFVARPDGGYLIRGNDPNTGQAALLQVDAQGNVQAAHTLTTTINIYLAQTAVLLDGRQVLVGGSDTGLDQFGIAMVLDTASQILRTELSGFGTISEWNGVTATADGGFVAVGNSLDALNTQVGILARYDSQLDTVYTRALLPPTGERLTLKQVLELPGGHLLAVGERASANLTDYRPCLYKFTAAGDLLWAREYPLSSQVSQVVRGMGHDGQGTLRIATLTQNAVTGNRVAICSVDTNGTWLRGDEISGLIDPEVRAMTIGHLNRAVLVGTAFDSLGNYIGFNLAFDGTTVDWANTFQINGNGLLYDIQPSNTGGYDILAGDFDMTYLMEADAQGGLIGQCNMTPANFTSAMLNGSASAYSPGIRSGLNLIEQIIPTVPYAVSSQLVCAATGVASPHTHADWAVFPQPMHAHVRLQAGEGTITQSTELQVFDLAGRRVHPPVTRLLDGFEIQRGGLPAGIYAYQVLQGGQRVASGKLWVVD